MLDPASAAGWRQVSMASLCQRRDGDGDGDRGMDGDGERVLLAASKTWAGRDSLYTLQDCA